MVGSSRLSVEQARDILLSEGRRILAERGARTDPVGVDLAEAISNCEVARSSAYRAFQHDVLTPQQSFSEELAKSLLETDTSGDVTATTAAAVEVVLANPTVFAVGSPLELAVCLRELIRVTVRANLQAHNESPLRWLYMSTLAAVGRSAEPAMHPLAGVLRTEERTEMMVALYTELAGNFGLKLRTGWTWERLDAAVSAAVLGTAARMDMVEDLDGLMRPTGPGGELRTWTTCAVLVEGLMMCALEPDPSARASADLTAWITDSSDSARELPGGDEQAEADHKES